MGVLLKIAYRNLREHKTKTLIIGSIIAFGMLVLVVGNSVLDTATAGLEENFTRNFTGHVIVAASGVETPGLTLDTAFTSEGGTPRVPDHDRTVAFLGEYPGVVDVSSVITGIATAQLDGDGFGIMQFYGIEPDDYMEFFPDNINLLEGVFLTGDRGVVLSDTVRTMLEETSGREITVGDEILVTASNEITGTKIRELEVVGIYEFVSSSATLEMVSFVSLEDVRILNGMTAATDIAADLTATERSRLGAVDENDLFGGASGESGDDLFGNALFSDEAVVSSSSIDFDSILGDTSKRDELSRVDESAWHYVLLRLENEGMTGRTVRDLNRYFGENDLDLVAFEWVEGAGTIAELTYALKTVFNVLIFVVAVVAVIVIMNTLVISVTERIPEIGTMRAIGAQRRFVRRMILWETLMIALAFGGIGIVLGMGVTGVLGMTGIESSNQILQIFMGGPVLNPSISGSSVMLSLIGVVGAGLLASLYPASIALAIKPVVAMNQN